MTTYLESQPIAARRMQLAASCSTICCSCCVCSSCMQKLGNQCFWTVQLAGNTGQRTESEHGCESRSVISQMHCMGDAQRCRQCSVGACAGGRGDQPASRAHRRHTCIQSWQGSRALCFPKDPGLPNLRYGVSSEFAKRRGLDQRNCQQPDWCNSRCDC